MKKKLLPFLLAVLFGTAHANSYVIEDKVAGRAAYEEQKEEVNVDNLSYRLFTPHLYEVTIGGMYSYNDFRNINFNAADQNLYPSLNRFIVKSTNVFASIEKNLNQFQGIGFSVLKSHTPFHNFSLCNDVLKQNQFTYDGQPVTGLATRETSGLFFIRQYVRPDSSYNPYLEFALGASRQVAIVRLKDDRLYARGINNPFIMTLGFGIKKSINETLSWTSAFNLRNQKCAKFKGPNLDTLEGIANYYRTYDFKIGLIYGW